MTMGHEERRRIVIADMKPEIDCGRFPIKRVIGEKVIADVIFLAEAFTRPKVMYNLAKLGFTQSHTYFAWRNTKQETTRYSTELTQTDVREYCHPNLWHGQRNFVKMESHIVPAYIFRL